VDPSIQVANTTGIPIYLSAALGMNAFTPGLSFRTQGYANVPYCCGSTYGIVSEVNGDLAPGYYTGPNTIYFPPGMSLDTSTYGMNGYTIYAGDQLMNWNATFYLNLGMTFIREPSGSTSLATPAHQGQAADFLKHPNPAIATPTWDATSLSFSYGFQQTSFAPESGTFTSIDCGC
jgi:hypothetical protein